MSVSAFFWDSLCHEHGGLSHAVYHEAAHAVVAVHLGIAFVDVSVNSEPWKHGIDDNRLIGGGVQLTSVDDFKDVVLQDPQGSLQFCLAGVLAERLAYGHSLDRSYEVDVNLWRILAGLMDGQTQESIEAAVGMPLAQVTISTKTILMERIRTVTAVAKALGESAELSLTFNEVAEIVAGAEER
jgi:hypothetical protein